MSWRLRGGVAFAIALLVVTVFGRPASAETLEQALADAYLINPVLNAERARLRATDEQVAQVFEDAKVAEGELKEAADEENGLYDLPIDDDKNVSALTEAEPLGSSETSPYEWIDHEADKITHGGLP